MILQWYSIRQEDTSFWTVEFYENGKFLRVIYSIKIRRIPDSSYVDPEFE